MGTPPSDSGRTERIRVERRHPLPGYFECRRQIELLQRFQDLVRYQSWGYGKHEVAMFARPLEELLPPHGGDVKDSTALLRQETLQSIPRVTMALNHAGLSARMTYTKYKHKYDMEKQELVETPVSTSYHAIEDYYRLPETFESFEMLMEIINKGIGYYKYRMNAAFWELFNPLVWIAKLLHMPLFVLERAELLDEKTPSIWLKFFEWALRGAWLVILFLVASLLAQRLGVSIPWEVILSKL